MRDADAVLADPRAPGAKLAAAVEVLVLALASGRPVVPGSVPLLARLLFEHSLCATLRLRLADALAEVDHLDIALRAVRALRSTGDPIDVEVAAVVLIGERHVVHVRDHDVQRLRAHVRAHGLTCGPPVTLLARLGPRDASVSASDRAVPPSSET